MNPVRNFLVLMALSFICSNSFAQEIYTEEIEVPFAESPVPAAPNYADTSNWVALPQKEDMADLVPKNCDLKDRQADAKVDVFFLHPTTFLKGTGWNADLTDEELNNMTAEFPVKYQSTVFNGSCKIYAPRYRQAHIRSFFYMEEGGQESLDIAYADVKEAFQYYMDHYNNGRPFIIASHSQGTYHASRLLRDVVEGTELQDQMVAAYIIGFPVRDTTFEVLQPCTSPDQTGCFVSYGTYAEDYYPEIYDVFLKDAIIVNPVSWNMDTTAVSYTKQKGYVGKSFSKPKTKVWGTRIVNGMLWVTKPHVFLGKFLRMKDFHIGDYNIFWMDIRENVALRCKTYLNDGVETTSAE